MNSRERVRTALRCQRPDRIPKALGFFPQSLPQIAPVAPEDYFGLDVRYVQFKPPPEQEAFRRYLADLPPDIHVGSLDQLQTYHEWGYAPEQGSVRQTDPAQAARTLRDRILPRLTNPERHADLAAQVTTWHQAGWAVAGAPPHLGGELFESAYRLRGFEVFLLDLASRKALAAYLLDQLLALLLHNVAVLAEAGVDVLLLDDDVAMPTGLLISPDTWRAFFKPRWLQAIRTAREIAPELLIFYHCDGHFSPLVPELIEIGVNVINPLQPDCMDALALKRAFGDRLALWGTVGTAWRWDRGTPQAMRAEVRRRMATLGPEGLLLAPAYDLAFAPWANIAAFCEAADEYGGL